MTSITEHIPIGLSSPVTFLGATVLSFNGSLGFGGQESTLTVELVEDCDANQVFANGNPDALIGQARCFPSDSGGMGFGFCGIITNWTKNDSSSGLTYSVTLTDPRRILENFAIIVDTYSGPLIQPGTPNVRNVYAEYEAGGCANFGSSGNISDRGMPYSKIISKLGSVQVTTPTNRATLTMSLSKLPSGLPPHYRVNGPSISLLQLITDVCEATGNDFYIYMPNATTIDIGLISLSRTVSADEFNWIRNYGVNNQPPGVKVIDRSYGREMRVEKQKTIIFGEKRHYLTMATKLKPFFGEDNQCNAVTATPGGACGFNVLVNTAPLAASLRNPGVFLNAGNKRISEVDLRCNFDLWKERVLVGPEANLSEFDLLAKQWMKNQQIEKSPRKTAEDLGISQEAYNQSEVDSRNNPQNADTKLAQERYNEDVKKIFGYIESLQQTYYGKQYLGELQDIICYKRTGDSNASTATGGCASSEMVYSAEPTNDGGWVDGGSVMGVSDPYLGFFKQEDGRIGSFALFSIAGDTPPSDGTGGGSNSGGTGENGGGGGANSGGTGGS